MIIEFFAWYMRDSAPQSQHACGVLACRFTGSVWVQPFLAYGHVVKHHMYLVWLVDVGWSFLNMPNSYLVSILFPPIHLYSESVSAQA